MVSDIERLVEALNQTMEVALRIQQRQEELERRGVVDVEARAALVSLQTQVATLSDSYDGHAHHWTTITNKPATFPPDAHSHAWSAITDKPSTFPPESHSHDWLAITGKPATFPPDAHSQDWTTITGKPATFPPESHGNSAHTETYITGVSWDSVTGKPSEFPASMHGNERHNPDFVAVGDYSVHTHYVQVGGQWYTTTAPN